MDVKKSATVHMIILPDTLLRKVHSVIIQVFEDLVHLVLIRDCQS